MFVFCPLKLFTFCQSILKHLHTMYYYLNVTSVVADSDFEFEEKNTTKNVLKNFTNYL